RVRCYGPAHDPGTPTISFVRRTRDAASEASSRRSRFPNLQVDKRHRIMRRSSAIALCVSLVATASCYHSTQLAATWHEPNPQPIDFKKMVTVFVAKDQAMRRSVEDKLASQFPNAVPSYRVLSATPDSADRTEILQRFRREGFDGAIIMRVTNVSM